MYIFVDLMIIRIVNFYVDARGEILGKLLVYGLSDGDFYFKDKTQFTCKPMAVSFQCMTKFTTNKKKGKKT